MKVVLLLSSLVAFLPLILTNDDLFDPQVVPYILKEKLISIIGNKLGDTECGTDLKILVTDLYGVNLWAVKMWDASGKLPAGILSGNSHLTGNYDFCLTIKEHVHGRTIEGQYCTFTLVSSNSTTKSQLKRVINEVARQRDVFDYVFENTALLGICLPKSCTAADLTRLATQVQELSFRFDDKYCQYRDKPVESYGIDSYVFCFFGIVISAVLASTAYDVYLRSTKPKQSTVFRVFSLYTNTKSLFSTTPDNDRLTVLYGIRVLTMAWIILAHLVSIKSVSISSNTFYTIQWSRFLSSSFVEAVTYAFDTFFAISGLLVTYVHLKYSEKIRISLSMFYTYRILRLGPALFATVLIYTSVLKHLGEGPLWPYFVDAVTARSCGGTWWATLLFVSNYFTSNSQCITQAWYLSVDTQLHILAPLFLFSIGKYPRQVVKAIICIFMASMFYSFIATLVKNLEFVTMLGFSTDSVEYLHFSTLARLPSWLVGVVFGYFIYHSSCNNTKIPNRINNILWTISLSTMVVLVLSTTIFLRKYHTLLFSAIFNAFARPLWATAVCFIVFSCTKGCGGLVHKFLSHPVFAVLDRLTYCMYLVHGVIVFLIVGRRRYPTHFGDLQNFLDFWGTYALSLIFGTFLCLVFEMPLLSIMKFLRRIKMGQETKDRK